MFIIFFFVPISEVVELIDRGFVVMIFLDFSKAFDVVNHSIMLTKLQMLDIGGKLLSLIHKILSGQTKSVKVIGKMNSLGNIAV